MSDFTPTEHHITRTIIDILRKQDDVFVSGDRHIEADWDECHTLVDGTVDMARLARQLRIRSARLPADPPGRGQYILIQVSGPPGSNGFVTTGFYGGEGTWYVGNHSQLLTSRVQCWWPMPEMLTEEHLSSLGPAEERPIA